MLKLVITAIIINNICGLHNVSIKTNENIVVYERPPDPQYPYPNYANKKEENVFKFLQKYNSNNPVIILIDNIKESHLDAYDFIKNVYKLNPNSENINFMLMKINTTGASDILETTKNNKLHFEKLLYQEVTPDPSSFLGRDYGNKSAVFFGITKAAQLLPVNSAIVVFIRRNIEDEDITPYAWTETAKKRIRVFVVWGGKSEDRLLKELALGSGGDYLISSRNLSQLYYENFLENIAMFTSVSTILSRTNLYGDYNLHFPIDSDVTGIHVSITPNITKGILSTPKGYKMDVLNDKEVTQYSIGSFVKQDDGIYEIHLNTTTATTQDVGIWHFRVSNARAYYNITIFAHTKLTTNAFITTENVTGTKNKTGSKKKVIKLGISGDISSISSINFISNEGNVIIDNVKYTLDKNWENHLTENINNTKTNQKRELDINIEKIPKGPFYTIVNGKDSQGNNFTRLSYVQDNIHRDNFFSPPLSIDVGLGSELITQPYRQPQIFFEVTNNGNTPTLVRFFCRDEKAILLSMNPWFKWISPQETVTVRLTLTTKPGFYKDHITFIATGLETVEKKVIVDVGSTINDKRDPELDYHFTSDCLKVLIGNCEDGTWSIEVKARDTDSGLLQVMSRPRGIYFPNGFTTGTTEEVTGYFSESCCNADLRLIAIDRENNRRTKELNAYRASLGPGAIAAIVLGVILLLLIIIIIILLCIKYPLFRKKKESYDLPTYRGPSSTSRRL